MWNKGFAAIRHSLRGVEIQRNNPEIEPIIQSHSSASDEEEMLNKGFAISIYSNYDNEFHEGIEDSDFDYSNNDCYEYKNDSPIEDHESANDTIGSETDYPHVENDMEDDDVNSEEIMSN